MTIVNHTPVDHSMGPPALTLFSPKETVILTIRCEPPEQQPVPKLVCTPRLCNSPVSSPENGLDTTKCPLSQMSPCPAPLHHQQINAGTRHDLPHICSVHTRVHALIQWTQLIQLIQTIQLIQSSC